MCGRYTITVSLDELMLRFFLEDVSSVPYHQPRYNVAPGQMVMAIINDGSRNKIGELRWGLVPQWAKDEKIGYKMLNARAETVAEKPAYKLPLQRKRCLIPADSFYEWKDEEGKKQPMRIRLKDGGIFAMAGLYDVWTAPDGRKVSSCTIITTTSNPLMTDIHERMPVILKPEEEDIWLNREIRDPQVLLPLLKPYDSEQMEAYPVSPLVGNVKNDVPACIEEVFIGKN